MTARLRFVAIVIGMVLHVALGLAIVAFLFPFARTSGQQSFIRWWSGRLLAVMRVRMRVLDPTDAARPDVVADALRVDGCGAMLVLNHLSWLDIFVVHALRPAHFIAKAEISRWPLLGYLVDRTGAVFIERGKRHAVREANQRVGAMLAAGDLVGMFPEGTVGDGDRLLPFHANLIQPAIAAGSPIVVAAIRYRDERGAPTTATLYVGDTTILQSLLRIARMGPIVAELRLIDAIDSRGASRHEVVREARTMIAAVLGFDDDAREIAEELSMMIVVPALNPGPAPAGTRPGTASDPRDELL